MQELSIDTRNERTPVNLKKTRTEIPDSPMRVKVEVRYKEAEAMKKKSAKQSAAINF